MFGKNKMNEEDPKHEKTESKAKEKKEHAGGKGSKELSDAIGQMPKGMMGKFRGQY